MTKQERREAVAQDILDRYGITLDFKGVATAANCSVTTVRRAFWRGELVGSRVAKRGPVRFTARAVAAWLIAGEERAF